MTTFVPSKSTSLVTGGPPFSLSSFFTSVSCSWIYLGADFSWKAKTFLCPFSILCHTIYACKHLKVCLFGGFLLGFRIKDRPQPQDLYLPCVQHGEGKGIFCFDSWLQCFVIISHLFSDSSLLTCTEKQTQRVFIFEHALISSYKHC